MDCLSMITFYLQHAETRQGGLCSVPLRHLQYLNNINFCGSVIVKEPFVVNSHTPTKPFPLVFQLSAYLLHSLS